MNKTKKIILTIAGVVFLIAAIAAMWFVYQANKPAANEGTKSITVKVISERDSYNFEKQYDTDEDYLGDFLEHQGLIEFDTSTYGRFITGVMGYKANTDEQSWWNILVDGESTTMGVDEIAIANGSVYTLQLVIGW